MTSPEELDQRFQISYDYVRKNYGDWENRQIIAPLPPFGMEIAKGAIERKPQEPVLLGALGKATFHSKVELPGGYQPATPAKCHLTEPFAEYTADTQIKNGVMITSRELEVKKNEVPLEAWENYGKFGRALSDDESSFIQLGASSVVATKSRDETENELRTAVKADPENALAAATLGEVLIRDGKHADAQTVLEAAALASPENANLKYELGLAYLKNGDKPKALSHLREAVEIKDDDVLMLNNVADTLAENKMALDLAREYGQKALDELDEEAKDSRSSDPDGLRVTYKYSLVWDTLGWIWFEKGDIKQAESLIRPAWLLGEQSLVAEHLAEIYEKQGKVQQAARTYEYALAIAAESRGFLRPNPQEERADEIKGRYKKLVGKEPELNTTYRLPSGEWTQTPAERLRHSREIKVANDTNLSGSAQFIIKIKPGKVDGAHFVSGDSALEAVEDELAKAHYPVEFPSDSEAFLTVQLTVRCFPSVPCVATLVKPVPEHP